MSIEETVARHYKREGVADSILRQAVDRKGSDQSLTVDDLANLDDMHIGGRQATAFLADAMMLKAGSRLLDVGSGIGGPARFIAAQYDVHVSGIDLTPHYKDEAECLSAAVGLDEKTAFFTGSALGMSFDTQEFDGAYCIHVGMNIREKDKMYAEVFRTLKPGGVFAVYDVMLEKDDGVLSYPLPWADSEASSFPVTPEDMKSLLERTHFKIGKVVSRRDFAIAALQRNLESADRMSRGDDFQQRVANLLVNIDRGYCAPYLILAHKE